MIYFYIYNIYKMSDYEYYLSEWDTIVADSFEEYLSTYS